jgi:hypothetical protein
VANGVGVLHLSSYIFDGGRSCHSEMKQRTAHLVTSQE